MQCAYQNSQYLTYHRSKRLYRTELAHVGDTRTIIETLTEVLTNYMYFSGCPRAEYKRAKHVGKT